MTASPKYHLVDWPERAERLASLLREWAGARLQFVPTSYTPELKVTETRRDFINYLVATGQMVYPIPMGAQFDLALANALPQHAIERGGKGGGYYRGIRWRKTTGKIVDRG
jgi:hypothetical protein